MLDAYLLDTNIASALWDERHADHSSFRAKVGALAEDRVFVSVITIAEVAYGLRVAPNIDRRRHEMVRRNMASYVVMPFDRHVSESYAELRARLFKKHSPRDARGRLTAKVVPDLWERTPDKLLGIQENDLWQASLAMERNLVLVTNDRMSKIVEVAGQDLRTERWA